MLFMHEEDYRTQGDDEAGIREACRCLEELDLA